MCTQRHRFMSGHSLLPPHCSCENVSQHGPCSTETPHPRGGAGGGVDCYAAVSRGSEEVTCPSPLVRPTIAQIVRGAYHRKVPALPSVATRTIAFGQHRARIHCEPLNAAHSPGGGGGGGLSFHGDCINCVSLHSRRTHTHIGLRNESQGSWRGGREGRCGA